MQCFIFLTGCVFVHITTLVKPKDIIGCTTIKQTRNRVEKSRNSGMCQYNLSSGGRWQGYLVNFDGRVDFPDE